MGWKHLIFFYRKDNVDGLGVWKKHTHENTHKHPEHKHIHSYIDAHAKQMQFDQQ